MIKLYGIKNCDSVKKAGKYLEDSGIEYKFHDFKKDGLERNVLQNWVDVIGWEPLLNKRGTTWRKLPDEVKESVVDSNSAICVMLDNLSVIKRPVVENDGKIAVGFDSVKELV